uniref:Uncharacterized protein n=1 Tax=Candidatus Kentrum sp. FM TaxID=2126340 RepID=A0A450RW05_9GAMM|nr:MAG: Protein of unknown function (DUF3987) [Candidatus Kentron sp. FM]VFJ43366.1 MAG: Protein of unknown function (DUF3987) [Candidatus Kentron sp. FM]VFK05515.1 MAG: Protein of unknown function (DUF3987) [Candidatus Kentron sp. FM]
MPIREGNPIPHLVRLSPEAAEARRLFHNRVEMQMADGQEYQDARDIASKAVSATVKTALVLYLLECPQALAETESELPVEIWTRAQRLGEYHLAEAVRIQRLADGDTIQDRVAELARWMVNQSMKEVTPRHLSHTAPRPHRAGTTKEAEQLLDEMEDMNWVRKMPPPVGKRKPIWRLNPKLPGTLLSRFR